MKLREWIENNSTPKNVAKHVGVDAVTVRRYMRGDRIPTKDVMVKIFNLTSGQVEPNDFYL